MKGKERLCKKSQQVNRASESEWCYSHCCSFVLLCVIIFLPEPSRCINISVLLCSFHYAMLSNFYVPSDPRHSDSIKCPGLGGLKNGIPR